MDDELIQREQALSSKQAAALLFKEAHEVRGLSSWLRWLNNMTDSNRVCKYRIPYTYRGRNIIYKHADILRAARIEKGIHAGGYSEISDADAHWMIDHRKKG